MEMEIVLRNQTNRKDAIYIVHQIAGHLTGYWGKHSKYLKDGRDGLSSQSKGQVSGLFAADKLLRQKLGKGYIPIDLLDVPESLLNTLISYLGILALPFNHTSPVVPKEKKAQAIKEAKVTSGATVAGAAVTDLVSAAAKTAEAIEVFAQAVRPKVEKPKTRASFLEF